jgi:hypothetical protein
MNENWMKLTHLLSKLSLNLMTPFNTSTFTSKKPITFLNVHTIENLIHLRTLSIVCMLMPQIITLLTLMLVRSTWYEESTPWEGVDAVINVDYQ